MTSKGGKTKRNREPSRYKEDFSSINLYALHCELRNTEQLLSLLGLFPYKVGSLDECNAELANYGPKNFGSKITVKMKEGQETAVEKHNIQVTLHFQVPSVLFHFCHDSFNSLYPLEGFYFHAVAAS